MPDKMFDPLKNDLKDAIRYPFLDWKIILITGGLLFAITILNKSDMSKIGLAISLLKVLISAILIKTESYLSLLPF